MKNHNHNTVNIGEFHYKDILHEEDIDVNIDDTYRKEILDEENELENVLDIGKDRDDNIEHHEEGEIMDEETTNDQNVTEPFKCNCCGKTFLRHSWLVRHGFSHPELNKDEYPCFHCNNLYQGKFAKGSYKKHIDRIITREETHG